MILNNPYLYHPHPLCKAAAGDLCSIIKNNPIWHQELAKGKMLGVLLIRRFDGNDPRAHIINNEYAYIAAYSGIVSIDKSADPSSFDLFFVPPVYDLNDPGDFYKQEEANISAINARIKELEKQESVFKHLIASLKRERKQRSQALQIEIFKHFNFTNKYGETKNILDIFADAKRGLPPGGAGECAAPRLLQYAFTHGLEPVAMAEFWYGVTSRLEIRLHRQFYPSCIDKCSPILHFMLDDSTPEAPQPLEKEIEIVYDDADLAVVLKPHEVLSTPGKDTTIFNVESWLHERFPETKGPMLVHRLDQSTSGLMIAAKNANVYKTLQQGFLDHSIRKRYTAWLDGNLASDCGVINLPICPNPDDRPRQTVDRLYGKETITRYRVLERKDGKTKVALYPFTGRTHQLRMHCASPFGLDTPIVGDRLYNIEQYINCNNNDDSDDSRLMLHAAAVSFVHPVSGERLSFEKEIF